MSAALTHAAVGLLLGLALRLRLRDLPLAVLLAVAPDLDHLGLFVPLPAGLLVTRVTLHNVLFCVLLPVAAYLALAWRAPTSPWRRLAAGAPLLMSSHLFLDILPLDVSSPKVALWYPFSGAQYTASARQAFAADPTAYSTMTLLILTLCALTVGTLLAAERGERASRGPGARRLVVPVVFGVAWIVLFPALGAVGYTHAATAYPDANFSLEQATLLLPQARFTAVVAHLGGADVGKGMIRVELLSGSKVLNATSNPTLFLAGGRWGVDLALPAGVDAASGVRARLVSSPHVYLDLAPTVKLGHFEAAVVVKAFTMSATSGGTLTLSVNALEAVPADALRAVLLQPDGTVSANMTNTAPFAGAAEWRIPFPTAATLPDAQWTIRVNAVDDGFRYIEARQSPQTGP